MAERSWRDIWRMERSRAFAPLREGGAARRKMAHGCKCGAEGKGGGGSTAGGHGYRLSHGPSAEGLILWVRCEVVLAATADRSTPPVAAPAACFCHASAFHSWPRHPPLGGGSVLSPSLGLAFVGFRRWFHYNPRRTDWVLRGIWRMEMAAVRLRGGIRRMEGAQALAPLREGGAARLEERVGGVPFGQKERAAGGVLRVAVEACFRMVHPQRA